MLSAMHKLFGLSLSDADGKCLRGVEVGAVCAALGGSALLLV